ncbi:hypothetical protein PENTCL1PPCAC_161, partial [Pristionchus entomophagus]
EEEEKDEVDEDEEVDEEEVVKDENDEEYDEKNEESDGEGNEEMNDENHHQEGNGLEGKGEEEEERREEENEEPNNAVEMDEKMDDGEKEDEDEEEIEELVEDEKENDAEMEKDEEEDVGESEDDMEEKEVEVDEEEEVNENDTMDEEYEEDTMDKKNEDDMMDEENEEDDASIANNEDVEVEDDDSDVEDQAAYVKGGYHRVTIGDKFKNNKYTVVRKLGFGQFSTVWLCEEKKNKQVALKIVQSNESFTQVANDEIKLLKHIRDADKSDPHRNKIVSLLDTFHHVGENGRHVCMVFEAIECDLHTFTIQNNIIAIDKVKSIIGQVLEGLDYMHTKCQMIHTDIKPENILVSMADGKIKVKIADLGNACWTYKKFSEDIQTREYR